MRARCAPRNVNPIASVNVLVPCFVDVILFRLVQVRPKGDSGSQGPAGPSRIHIEEIAESHSASCIGASGPAIALCMRQ